MLLLMLLLSIDLFTLSLASAVDGYLSWDVYGSQDCSGPPSSIVGLVPVSSHFGGCVDSTRVKCINATLAQIWRYDRPLCQGEPDIFDYDLGCGYSSGGTYPPGFFGPTGSGGFSCQASFLQRHLGAW